MTLQHFFEAVAALAIISFGSGIVIGWCIAGMNHDDDDTDDAGA